MSHTITPQIAVRRVAWSDVGYVLGDDEPHHHPKT
jgi:hypothetical protein